MALVIELENIKILKNINLFMKELRYLQVLWQ